MPQFDQVTFLNQVFWFFLGFFCFYFVTVYFFLPLLCENLKYRKKKLENNFLMVKTINFENIAQYMYINQTFASKGEILIGTITETLATCFQLKTPLKTTLYTPFSFKEFSMNYFVPLLNFLKVKR